MVMTQARFGVVGLPRRGSLPRRDSGQQRSASHIPCRSRSLLLIYRSSSVWSQVLPQFEGQSPFDILWHFFAFPHFNNLANRPGFFSPAARMIAIGAALLAEDEELNTEAISLSARRAGMLIPPGGGAHKFSRSRSSAASARRRYSADWPDWQQ